MDIRRPHEIHEPAKPERAPRLTDMRPAPAREVPLAERWHRFYLHDRELRTVRHLDEDARAAWLAKFPPGERLARFLAEENVPHWIVSNARRGRYEPGQSTYPNPRWQLVEHLREVSRVDLAELVLQQETDDAAAQASQEPEIQAEPGS